MNSVSVIIPAYNAAVCLKRCLGSVFGQEYPTKQVIVVNDGSTDNTKKIAEGYANRIEYYEQENQGPGLSRNTGLRAARGDYVAFLDADDYWRPGFLTKCVSFLEKHPDAVAVSVGQLHNLWGHGESIRPPLLQNSDCPKEPFIIDNFFSFWAEHNHVVTGSNLIRRSVIEKAGYQCTHFRACEDLEYWGYLATFGKWGFIPEILWVGDPTPAAASQGWLKKHSQRWQNLPTLEQWESRILPRLSADDLNGFQKVKSRVAASLVHQNILAGNDEEAKCILMQFKEASPKSHILRLLHAGVKGGAVGWFLVCKMIRLRERMKSNAISFSHRRLSKNCKAPETVAGR
jgi:hypothetical protein